MSAAVRLRKSRLETIRLALNFTTPGLLGAGVPIYETSRGDVLFGWWLSGTTEFDGSTDELGIYLELARKGSSDVFAAPSLRGDDFVDVGREAGARYVDVKQCDVVPMGTGSLSLFLAETPLVVRVRDTNGAAVDPLPTEGEAEFALMVLRAW